jgi:hypothetical protein
MGLKQINTEEADKLTGTLRLCVLMSRSLGGPDLMPPPLQCLGGMTHV